MRKRIHFVGIKGVGMTPLAIIAKEAGFTVSGCDVDKEFITDEPLQKNGIVPLKGFSRDHINDIDLVITTGAHGGFDNIENLKAKEKNIPVLTQGEALGEFMNGKILNRSFKGISVAGCHGKTTTTAILISLFSSLGLDASYAVGTSTISQNLLPGHFGKGDYFIAEADEYASEPVYDRRAKFLLQKPFIGIITNIELDHPDLYPTIEAMRSAYLQFVRNIQPNGLLICCGDDSQVQKLLTEYEGKRITYGYGELNDYILTKVSVSGGQTFFHLKTKDIDLGEFVIKVPGNHNALNALATIIVALECGISLEKIRQKLPFFLGVKRRFEYVGKLESGALLFDDYAHHPTEIKKTLAAFRQVYPKEKIICIFQPHTYSRTKLLFDEFMYSFEAVDLVILTNIYSSEREQKDDTVSSELLANAMKKNKDKVYFLPTLPDVVKYIKQNNASFNNKTIVITMGAGDVYQIAEQLLINN